MNIRKNNEGHFDITMKKIEFEMLFSIINSHFDLEKALYEEKFIELAFKNHFLDIKEKENLKFMKEDGFYEKYYSTEDNISEEQINKELTFDLLVEEIYLLNYFLILILNIEPYIFDNIIEKKLGCTVQSIATSLNIAINKEINKYLN